MHGQRVCEATLSKSGDANDSFTLTRRFDKAGYNERKRPFVENQKSRIGNRATNKNNLQDENGMSILSLQNEFKMPGPAKRKEKGQVIEKILENSNKPWYLQTQQ